MQTRILLSVFFAFLFFQLGKSQPCGNAERYLEPIFEENEITVTEIPFATFQPEDLWANGDTSNTCFPVQNYLDLNTNGSFTMKMDIYQPDPDIDNCEERLTIVFLHGGGYAHISGNKRGSTPVGIAMYAARLGYVVAVLDYRKGWDIAEATNPLCAPLLPGCQNCGCDGPECEQFTFALATYRMAQDMKAGHKKLINVAGDFGIDINNIHYWGTSTGGVGIMSAAYGGEDMEQYMDDHGNTMRDLAGPLDRFGEEVPAGTNLDPKGVHIISGAIADLNWIQPNDHIPLMMTHGSKDEAVPYCTGRILDMKYNCTNNVNHLLVYGPGKIYRQLNCLGAEGMKGHLYTYNGLYHSLTIFPTVNTTEFNCNEADTQEEILAPGFAFCRNIWEGGNIENEHHRFVNAATDNVECNIVREDTSTQCGYVNCELTVADHEVFNLEKYTVFPNPNNGDLNISFSKNNFYLNKIELFNLTGKLVYSEKYMRAGETFYANIKHLPSGLYFIRINEGVPGKVILE